jgi:putative tryptophan/tyrosine transport system substrate-binding protein
MRRRDLLVLAAGAVALQPLALRAQQPKMPTIGVLVTGVPGSEKFWRIFREALRELGYVEGQTVSFEFRSDGGQASRRPELAGELVALKVDLIVAWFTPAATAAKQATRDIPIVMTTGDPVSTGLVDSLARPGGNITGMSGFAPELAGKCVELVREVLPSSRRAVALVNVRDASSKPILEKMLAGAGAIGVTVAPISIDDPDEVEAAFAAMKKDPPDAVVIQPSLPTTRIAELALRYRIPGFSPFRPFAEAGGLMSYWLNEAETYRRMAVFVDKILKGAKPADLPVEQPTKFELVVNLRTAKALGVTVPQLLLARADEVIE